MRDLWMVKLFTGCATAPPFRPLPENLTGCDSSRRVDSPIRRPPTICTRTSTQCNGSILFARAAVSSTSEQSAKGARQRAMR
jgi:hypothetical protein